MSGAEADLGLLSPPTIYNPIRMEGKVATSRDGAYLGNYPSFPEALSGINSALAMFVPESETTRDTPGLQSIFERQIEEKAEFLLRDLNSFAAAVHLEATKPYAQEVLGKHLRAQQRANGLGSDAVVVETIKEFHGEIQIVTDFDLTMTQDDSYLSSIPGSIFGEAWLKTHGRESFAHAFSRFWERAMLMDKRAFKHVGYHLIDFRPGVDELMKWSKDSGIPYTVSSAQFEPILLGALLKLPADGIGIYAVKENDIRSTAKDVTATAAALSHPNHALFACLDGASDFEMLRAAPFITAMFVLRNGGLHEILSGHDYGIPYYLYDDHNDIGTQISALRDAAMAG